MKKKTKIILIVCSIIIILIISFSFTYAYLNGIVKGNTKEISIKSKDLLITFNGGNNITASNIYPGNTIEKTFTIVNSGSDQINYNLAWYKINSTFENNELVYYIDCKSYSKYVSSGSSENVLNGTCTDYNNEEQPLPKGTKNIGIVNNDIPKGYTHEYTLTLKYLDYSSMTHQNSDATFSADIYVNDNATYEVGFKDKIMSDKSSMIVNTPATNPGVAISGSTESNLVRQEVSTGKYTYYFRGNVTNNYVFFGGFYWRIIRINEDGSVRMIYAGTTSNATGSNSTIGPTTYAFTQTGGAQYPTDITTVGYMIADPTNRTYFTSSANFTVNQFAIQSAYKLIMGADDTTTEENEAYTFDSTTGYYTLLNPSTYYIDSSTFPANSRMYMCYSTIDSACNRMYEIITTDYSNPYYRIASGVLHTSGYTISNSDAESNQVDNKIKNFIDTWYSNNLVNYTALLADPGFCNSRRKAPGFPNAYGTINAYYYNYYEYINSSGYGKTLNCFSQNDLFTVSNSSGNKRLTYPVGLITSYEMQLLGHAYNITNNYTYLSTSSNTPTMTAAFNYRTAYPYFITLGVNNKLFHTGNHITIYPKPVINLKGNLVATGTGTSEDPYIINYEN